MKSPICLFLITLWKIELPRCPYDAVMSLNLGSELWAIFLIAALRATCAVCFQLVLYFL
jgi:hypothetical protein